VGQEKLPFRVTAIFFSSFNFHSFVTLPLRLQLERFQAYGAREEEGACYRGNRVQFNFRRYTSVSAASAVITSTVCGLVYNDQIPCLYTECHLFY
jgi:hypothetical protein